MQGRGGKDRGEGTREQQKDTGQYRRGNEDMREERRTQGRERGGEIRMHVREQGWTGRG